MFSELPFWDDESFLLLEFRSKFGRFPGSVGTGATCVSVARRFIESEEIDFPRIACYGVSALILLETCSGVCAGVLRVPAIR